MSALAYTTSDDMGLYGAQKSLFALRKTLHLVPRQGQLLGKVSKLYDSPMSTKGLRHALDLNKEWGVIVQVDGQEHQVA